MPLCFSPSWREGDPSASAAQSRYPIRIESVTDGASPASSGLGRTQRSSVETHILATISVPPVSSMRQGIPLRGPLHCCQVHRLKCHEAQQICLFSVTRDEPTGQVVRTVSSQRTHAACVEGGGRSAAALTVAGWGYGSALPHLWTNHTPEMNILMGILLALNVGSQLTF